MSAVREYAATGTGRCGGCGIAVWGVEMCSVCEAWERDGLRLKAQARLMRAIADSHQGRSDVGTVLLIPEAAPRRAGLFVRIASRVLDAPTWIGALSVACTGAFLLVLLGMFWQIGVAAVRWLLAVSA